MLNRGETECMFGILNESGSDPGIKAAQGMDGGIDIDGKRPDRPINSRVFRRIINNSFWNLQKICL